VEEQSHKDEMRAALRGDFERMRRRQATDDAPAHQVAARPFVPAVSPDEPRVLQPNEKAGSWLDRLLGRG